MNIYSAIALMTIAGCCDEAALSRNAMGWPFICWDSAGKSARQLAISTSVLGESVRLTWLMVSHR